MSKNKDIKNYCYSNSCGPAIQTGFQEQYWICRSCREEITSRLAQDIKQREEDKKKGKDSDLTLEEMWSTHYGKLPDGNDDGFY